MEGTSPRVKTGKDKPPWGWRGLHAAGQPGHSSSSCSPAPSTHRGWQRPVPSAGILCWPSSHRDNPREGDPGLAHVSSYGESSGAGVSRLYGYCESLRAPGSQDMQKPPESTTHRHIPASAFPQRGRVVGQQNLAHIRLVCHSLSGFVHPTKTPTLTFPTPSCPGHSTQGRQTRLWTVVWAISASSSSIGTLALRESHGHEPKQVSRGEH